MKEHIELSQNAVAKSGGRLDLIVWPETMYREPLWQIADDYVDPPDAPYPARDYIAAKRRELADLAQSLGVPLLLGIDAVEWNNTNPKHFNSAVLVDEKGEVQGRYDKLHLVMFGEYIPFARWMPWIYNLSPMTGGVEIGSRPEALLSRGVRYAPSVCYETVIPHVIRRQVVELRRRGEEPDILVNVTNDSWFHGSSQLPMHLACDVFRAVECRKPLLVAANGGISAWIDGDGRVRKESPRQATDIILADVELDRRDSLYLIVGDLPAGLCLAFCVALAAVGIWDWRRLRKRGAE